MSVCLFEHAILAVCTIKSIVKDVSQEPVECRLGSIVNLPCMMHIALRMCPTVVIVFILLSICDCNLNFTVYIYINYIYYIYTSHKDAYSVYVHVYMDINTQYTV